MAEQAQAAARQRPEIIVVGASAGGVEVLQRVMADLPRDLPVPVLVVLHVASTGRSVLARILDRVSALPCATAADGDALEPGHVYVAPPNQHLVVEDGHARLDAGPRENGHRPAVDVLFRTAAAAYGARCCGVVLSGTRDDGTIGLGAIKRAGGTTVVQDPEDAAYPGMPQSAVAHVAVDAVLTAAELGPALAALARDGALPAPARAVPDAVAAAGAPVTAPVDPPPICPECGGPLHEELVDGVPAFRCHVGHVYAPMSLAAAQADAVERALWSGVRVLQERGALLRRMADHADVREQPRSATRFREAADDAAAHAEQLRGMIAVARVPTS